MGKYLLLWSLNVNHIPADPKERAAGWGQLMDMVKQDLQKGLQTDWGSFPGENMGYCIVKGNHLDVMKMTQQYAPYVDFEVHASATVEDVGELLKHLSG